MSYMVIDIFTDMVQAEGVKEQMRAIDREIVELKQVDNLKVNEYISGMPALKYKKDGKPMYVLITVGG